MTKATKRRRPRKFVPTSKPGADQRTYTASTNSAGAPPGAPTGTRAPEAKSKTARVIALLQREEGASLIELVTETGWQAHTTRAALTGLRKKGHVITSDKIGDVRRYRGAAVK